MNKGKKIEKERKEKKEEEEEENGERGGVSGREEGGGRRFSHGLARQGRRGREVIACGKEHGPPVDCCRFQIQIVLQKSKGENHIKLYNNNNNKQQIC